MSWQPVAFNAYTSRIQEKNFGIVDGAFTDVSFVNKPQSKTKICIPGNKDSKRLKSTNTVVRRNDISDLEISSVAVNEPREVGKMKNKTSDREPVLLKPKEAAEFLSVSERSLWTLMRNGEIPHIRIGKSVRYLVKDLESWIETKRVQSKCV